jgi:hypothetical protein
VNDQVFVVSSREHVPARRFGHGQEDTVRFFHVPVPDAHVPAQLCSTHFHPDQVIRVIYDAHLIRFRIPHTQSDFTLNRHVSPCYDRTAENYKCS